MEDKYSVKTVIFNLALNLKTHQIEWLILSVCTKSHTSFVCSLIYVLDYTHRCSGVTPSSSLRSYSWCCLRNYMRFGKSRQSLLHAKEKLHHCTIALAAQIYFLNNFLEFLKHFSKFFKSMQVWMRFLTMLM